MLILTRRPGEILRIGDDVVIEVLALKGQQIRFGITAPKDIPVHREEIYQRIKAGVTAEEYAIEKAKRAAIHD